MGDARQIRTLRVWTALFAVPLMLLTGVFGAGVPAAQAAGDAQVIVSVVPFDPATNAKMTTMAPPQKIGFRVDVSCVTATCENATVKFDPTQLDPNHNFYRLLAQTGFTPPNGGGASIAGNATDGYTVSLGDMAAWSEWLRPALYLHGASSLLLGDAEAALELFAAGAEAADVLLPESAWAAYCADAGEWADAALHAAAAVDYVEKRHMEVYSTTALAFAVSARVAIQRGDVETGERHLMKAMRTRAICTPLIPYYAVALRLQLAKAHYAKGDLLAAAEMVREIERIIRRRPDLGTLLQDVDAFRRTLRAGPLDGANSTPLTLAELRVLPYLQTHLTTPALWRSVFEPLSMRAMEVLGPNG